MDDDGRVELMKNFDDGCSCLLPLLMKEGSQSLDGYKDVLDWTGDKLFDIYLMLGQKFSARRIQRFRGTKEKTGVEDSNKEGQLTSIEGWTAGRAGRAGGMMMMVMMMIGEADAVLVLYLRGTASVLDPDLVGDFGGWEDETAKAPSSRLALCNSLATSSPSLPWLTREMYDGNGTTAPVGEPESECR